MAIKRLHEGFGVGQDSCISGRHPMTEQDILKGTQGVYLGDNPEATSQGLFITFWEADEIAQAIGFPHIAVYEAMVSHVDKQAQRIADLEEVLATEVNSLQVQSVAKEVRKGTKEILSALDATLTAVRARLDGAGTDRVPSAPAGGAKEV